MDFYTKNQLQYIFIVLPEMIFIIHSKIIIGYAFSKYSKVKLVTFVEGDPKAPFSIATTLRCRGGRYWN